MQLINKRHLIGTIVFILSQLTVFSAGISKIIVNPAKVINEASFGNPQTLFDEQEAAGDPLHGTGAALVNNNLLKITPANAWDPKSVGAYPISAYVDLGKPYVLTNIYLRDQNNSNPFCVYKGYPGAWKLLFTDLLKGYMSWNAHTVSDTTRYLRFEMCSAASVVSEVVVYGYELYPQKQDTIPPSAIKDLKIDSVSTKSAYLSWTAPGNDNTIGKALFYEIRYSNKLITSQNFSSATKAVNVCTPLSAGLASQFRVDSLLPGTPYYLAMLTRDSMLNVSQLSNVVFGRTKYALNCAPYRLTLEPQMIINESGLNLGSYLCDEQNIAVDTTQNSVNNITTYWESPSSTWFYPVYLTIDLGTTYNIKKLAFLNKCSSTTKLPVSIYYGNPLNWQYVCQDSLTNYLKWSFNTLNVQSRYIRLGINSPGIKLNELAVYASPVEFPVETPTKPVYSPKKPLMNDFIGANAFSIDPVGRLKCVNFIREYRNWSWHEASTGPVYPNNQIYWDNQWGGFYPDIFYDNLIKDNVHVSPCIQKSVGWASTSSWKLENKPVTANEDPTDPQSYTEHANFMYQLAARYGSVTIPDAYLLLKSNQTRYSGMNLINYCEDWNEPNATWLSREGWFFPYEYAAMASVDYDGHQKTLGDRIGVKNADPSVKCVMAGLAGINMDYLKAMNFWFSIHRSDSVIPYDVINFHNYCKTTTGEKCGVSPESFNLKGKLEEVVKYRNENLPGKEVWLSEFGYDTNLASIVHAPQIGTCSQYETQARWLVRSYLAIAAAGVDKAFMYMLADVDSTSATQYATCGLTTQSDGGYMPKISWYYVYTMKNRLAGFRFDKEIESSNDSVKIYSFTNDSTHYKAYVVWCSSSSDYSVSQFPVNVDPQYGNLKIVSLENGYTNGVEINTHPTAGKINLDISEKPTFIIASVDSIFPAMPDIESKIYLDSTMVSTDCNIGNVKLLVDEQQLSGDPLMGAPGKPLTNWKPTYVATTTPQYAYIDLKTERDLTKVFLYDASGGGNFDISVGAPGNWTPLFTENLNNYLYWRSRTVHVKTRYLRLATYGNYGMYEILLYGK